MGAEVEAAQPVERDSTPVLFVRCADDLAEMQATWARFEDLVGLRGRRFYGAYYPLTEEYCVHGGAGNRRRRCARRRAGRAAGRALPARATTRRAARGVRADRADLRRADPAHRARRVAAEP